MVGAVTVVLASNASDIRLDIDGLLHAISQLPFIAFSIVYLVGAVVLAGLSESPLGRRWVFIDVGLCALFGRQISTFTVSYLTTQSRRIHRPVDQGIVNFAHLALDRNFC